MPSFWNSSSGNGDEWSNITLELGLEDVDSTQFQKGSEDAVLFQSSKLQLKEEEFFPSSFEHVLERPQFDFSPSSILDSSDSPVSPPSMTRSQSGTFLRAKPCPCCQTDFSLQGDNFHVHVNKCFMETAQSPKPATEQSIMESIQAIRKSVGLLDLHERISLTESLARLSRPEVFSALDGQKQPSNPLSSQAIESDHFLLSLLFASPSSKLFDVKEEEPRPVAKSPIIEYMKSTFPESTTPTMCPSSPTFNPLNSPITIAKNGAEHPARFRQPSKRKREVSQALWFDPPSPSKLQRLEEVS